MAQQSTFWTETVNGEARVEILKREWVAGTPVWQIQEMLGAKTRSTIIGKAHRLKLSMHKGAKNLGRGKPKPEPNPVIRFKNRDTKMPARGVRPDREVGKVELVDLLADDCRWPFEDADHHYTFCGCRVAVSGKPYCLKHTRASMNRSAPTVPQEGFSRRLTSWR